MLSENGCRELREPALIFLFKSGRKVHFRTQFLIFSSIWPFLNKMCQKHREGIGLVLSEKNVIFEHSSVDIILNACAWSSSHVWSMAV